jgi:hypothetical protein
VYLLSRGFSINSSIPVCEFGVDFSSGSLPYEHQS